MEDEKVVNVRTNARSHVSCSSSKNHDTDQAQELVELSQCHNADFIPKSLKDSPGHTRSTDIWDAYAHHRNAQNECSRLKMCKENISDVGQNCDDRFPDLKGVGEALPEKEVENNGIYCSPTKWIESCSMSTVRDVNANKEMDCCPNVLKGLSEDDIDPSQPL